MRNLLRFVAVSLACVSLATGASAQDKAARAQELLAKAREALGGDHKVKSVQSLWLSAKFQRVLGDEMPQVDGEIELSMLLPDKYKKSETMNLPVGGASVTRIEGLNGEERFSDSHTNSPGGGTIMFRRAEDRPGGEADALRATRADFARNVLSLLLNSTQDLPLEFAYAGQAQSPDGVAEMIDAKAPGGFSARLFLDKKTYQPLMMTYRAPKPQMKVMTQKFSGSREEAEKKKEEIEKEAAKTTPPQQEADIQIFFSDYRSVDGILLPHHISRAVDGKTSEEWDVKKYKVNPQLKPDSFSK
jgi:hypothetical protein